MHKRGECTDNASSNDEHSSVSVDDNQLFTKPYIDEPCTQVSDECLPFSQSDSANLLRCEGFMKGDDNEGLRQSQTIGDVDLGGQTEDDDNEVYRSEDDFFSVASVDSKCDKDVAVEEIEDIPESGRMTKTIKGYDKIFNESDLKDWKLKEKRLVDRF